MKSWNLPWTYLLHWSSLPPSRSCWYERESYFQFVNSLALFSKIFSTSCVLLFISWIVTYFFLLCRHYCPNYIINSLRACLSCLCIFEGLQYSIVHGVYSQEYLLMVIWYVILTNEMMLFTIFNKSKFQFKLQVLDLRNKLSGFSK